jgi:hypothetical protein
VPRSFAFFLAKGRESTTINLPDDQERTGVPGDAGPRGRVFVRGVMGQVFVAGVGKGPRTFFGSRVPKERSLLFGVEFGVVSRRTCICSFACLDKDFRDRR